MKKKETKAKKPTAVPETVAAAEGKKLTKAEELLKKLNCGK